MRTASVWEANVKVISGRCCPMSWIPRVAYLALNLRQTPYKPIFTFGGIYRHWLCCGRCRCVFRGVSGRKGSWYPAIAIECNRKVNRAAQPVRHDSISSLSTLLYEWPFSSYNIGLQFNAEQDCTRNIHVILELLAYDCSEGLKSSLVACSIHFPSFATQGSKLKGITRRVSLTRTPPSNSWR